MQELLPSIAEQIDTLSLKRGVPLIITDADEVLFHFMAGFEDYLIAEGMTFDWSSFALAGNVKMPDGTVVEREAVQQHLATFFERHTEDMKPVDHAAETLAELSQQAQVVVLSNLPLDQRDARIRALHANDMPYPLIAGHGPKGAPVKALMELADAPAVFIDDIPHNHQSVAKIADSVQRLHFVADPRLARLLEPSEHAHHRADRWPEARPFIETVLFG